MVPLTLSLDYAIEIWVGENRHLKYTPKIQKRAVIIIFGSKRKQSCKSCWKKFQVLTFPRIYMFQTIYFVKKMYIQYNNSIKRLRIVHKSY